MRLAALPHQTRPVQPLQWPVSPPVPTVCRTAQGVAGSAQIGSGQTSGGRQPATGLALPSQRCLSAVGPPPTALRRLVTAASASAYSASDVSVSEGEDPPSSVTARAAGAWARFSNLANKFMPMVGLFFLLAFVNTILDSLKDTLVITATGGGAQVGTTVAQFRNHAQQPTSTPQPQGTTPALLRPQ